MNFPTHYPALCPPASALEANGEIYRFVANDPPQPRDFISYHLLGKKYDKKKHCEACGLSVWITESAVKYCIQLNPYLRKRHVAKATVAPDWGKIVQTGLIPHHTWWFPEGKKPEGIFKVVTIS
jgi:hypothetical protein